MSLILAIEPDRRQAAQLTTLAQGPLNVELVVGDSTERAFEALGPRVPDLVLTSQLLSPKDETALAERLRELDAAGAHVQTLVIPVLGSEEGGKKRSVGGLFGRLRRSAGQDKASEGCDPAVFGTQITEYLERAATERAALAAAQADLEAAWAEEPPPVAPPANLDDTDFGEFAAIPIPTLPVASQSAPLAFAATDNAERVDPMPAPPAAASAGAGQVEEEWEEITLDAVAAESHNELTAETVDLDAFVNELHTVETTANAQPMIPVVDLTGRVSDDDLHQIRQNEDTVSAIFQAAEPALDLGDELERAVSPLEPSTQTVFVEPEPSVPEPSVPELIASETFLDASTPVVNAVPVEPASADDDGAAFPAGMTLEAPSSSPGLTASEVAAAFAAEIAPAPSAPVTELPPPPRAGWQDLLSAIRRDISHMKTDEPAPPPPQRAELDLSREPLVFPVRPALTASAIAEAMPVRAERPVAEPDTRNPLPSQVAHSLEASLQASLSAPLALTPEPTVSAPASEVGELRAAVEAQLANAIKTSEGAFATEPEAAPDREPEPMFVAEPMFAADDPVIAEFEQALESSVPVEEPAPSASHSLAVEPIFEGLLAADVAMGESLEPSAPVAAPALPLDDALFAVETEAQAAEVSAAPAVAVSEAPRRESSRKERGSKHKRKRRNEQIPTSTPATSARVGDWGFFDPQQVGFGALVAKLNEVTRRGQHAAQPRR